MSNGEHNSVTIKALRDVKTVRVGGKRVTAGAGY
jgi:hypothetical protein